MPVPYYNIGRSAQFAGCEVHSGKKNERMNVYIMAFCENCGKRVEPEDAYCGNCGMKLTPDTPVSRSNFGDANTKSIAKAVRCENCGFKLNPEDAFCGNCGMKQTSDLSVSKPVFEKKKMDPRKTGKGLFDGVSRENMEIFNSFSWTYEWENAAKKAAGEKELGIILTNLSALTFQLGVPETEIDRIISGYIASAKQRGVEYYLLRMDLNSVFPGNSVPNSVEDIVTLLRLVIDVARPKYLFILGDETIVDVATWENQSRENTHDADVDSDFAYTVLDTASPWEGQKYDLNEALRVGRLPTSDGDFEGFQRYFENAAKEIGSIDEIRSFGLSAEVWEEESQFEYEHFRNNSDDVETSPEVELADTTEMLKYSGEDYNLLFFNLHGHDQEEYWRGQSGWNYPEAVSPGVFEDYSVPFFLGVEACYGARYIGYTTEESILRTAMRNKCLAFLGSSRIALGGFVPEKRSWADIVIGDFLKHIACGETAGDAHILGLKALLGKHTIPLPDDILTAAEFALYGDPSACTGKNKHKGMIRGMVKKAIGGVPKGLHVPVPDVLRAANLYLAEVNAEIEAKVDAYVAPYLPYPQEDGTPIKGNGVSQETYQLQNGNLYNKTYSYETKYGRGFVTVYFDKNGNILEAGVSK